MKVVQINSVSGIGSTGKICESISDLLDSKGISNRIIYYHGDSKNKNAVKVGNEQYYKAQALKSRIFGNYGFNSKLSTKLTCEIIQRENPDIVHIHNIHGHEVNISQLFEYLKKAGTPIVWTMHDCWAVTGYCPHFTAVKCEKWRYSCNRCPQMRYYSWFSDRSTLNQKLKKKAGKGLDITVVTPSKWLANIMRESFLGVNPVTVINNGIDLDIFKPIASAFRKKHRCEDKIIVLGVANVWDFRKGLDIFIRLEETLGEEYQIVLVGTDASVRNKLPSGIIAIDKTNNQHELAEIYSTADMFINPTREENYPTVNLEAIACGTPVITFNTGGSPEMIDESCGSVVDVDDIDELIKTIKRYGRKDDLMRDKCVKKSTDFGANEKFMQYIELYNGILRKRK